MPEVSVVIPAYNSAKYLPETIESIISQSFKDIEIIIIDDASTDNTSDIIARINSSDIRYFRLEANHGGPSRPRNVGIQKAKGEFIAFCDSDDLFVPGRLSTAIKFLRNNPDIGMVFTDAQKFDEDTGADIGNFLNGYDLFHSLPKEKVAESCFIIASEDAFSCLFYENYIMPTGVTVRASVFETVGYFDETITNGDDRDMWFRISKDYPIGFIDKVGFKYRKRANSISTRGPELAINRSKVIRKQLNNNISPRLQKRCHKIIANNAYGIGYYYQSRGDMKNAKKHYCQSLVESFNWPALRGLFISILGKKIYFVLKKIKFSRNK
jgi:glycosyltransferase involved in cell wall biosynthesis